MSQTYEPIWYYDGSATVVWGHGLHTTGLRTTDGNEQDET